MARKPKDPATFELEHKLRAARRELRDMRGQLEIVEQDAADLEFDDLSAGGDMQSEIRALGIGALTAATVGGVRAAMPSQSDVAVPVASGALFLVGMMSDMPTLGAIGRTGLLLAIADSAERLIADRLTTRPPAADQSAE